MLLDVGGGHYQALEQIKNRLCWHDQLHVIDREALAAGIETCGTSLFQPNPVKGTRAYHFRHIFHGWSNQASVGSLRNVAQVMSSNSRIVISNQAVPSCGVMRAIVLQDLKMLAYAGMERIEEQWQDLIR